MVQVCFNSGVHVLKCVRSVKKKKKMHIQRSHQGFCLTQRFSDQQKLRAVLPPADFLCLADIAQEQLCGTFDTVFDFGCTAMRLHQLLHFTHIIQVPVKLEENNTVKDKENVHFCCV